MNTYNNSMLKIWKQQWMSHLTQPNDGFAFDFFILVIGEVQ